MLGSQVQAQLGHLSKTLAQNSRSKMKRAADVVLGRSPVFHPQHPQMLTCVFSYRQSVLHVSDVSFYFSALRL